MHIYRHRRRYGDRHVDRRRHRHIHCIDIGYTGIYIYISVYTYTCIQIEIWVECFLRSWSSRTHGISPFFWSFKMPYGSGARWNLKHPWLAFKKIPTNQHTSGTYQLRTQLWNLFMKKQSFHIWTFDISEVCVFPGSVGIDNSNFQISPLKDASLNLAGAFERRKTKRLRTFVKKLPESFPKIGNLGIIFNTLLISGNSKPMQMYVVF